MERDLTAAEQAILARLLESSFPGAAELRHQAVQARVVDEEDQTIDLEVPHTLPPAPVNRRIPVEAFFEDSDRTVVHVLLHVVGGYLSELEVYKEDNSPVLVTIEPNRLSVEVY